MGRARVSISSVTKFNDSVIEEKENAVSLKSAVNCIDEIVQKINTEIVKIIECKKNCEIALRTGNEKLTEFRKELAELTCRLSVTQPIIKELEPCGTDEEGNVKYQEVEKTNPEYYNLVDQISGLETRISKIRDLIEELLQKKQKLSKTEQEYQDAIINLNNGEDEIIACCDIILKKSDMASSQLEKAIAAIQKYLGETVRTEQVPSHNSINWGYHTSFDTTISSKDNIDIPKRTSDDDLGHDAAFYGVLGKHLAEMQDSLISSQMYGETCGLASAANILRELGVCDATEAEVLNLALQIDACVKPNNDNGGGATSNDDILKILSSYGLKTIKVHDLTIEKIMDCLNKGGAVMMSVQAKYLRDGAKIPSYLGFKRNTDHWVTVTGVKKNQYTNEVLGIFVQDTGGYNSNCNIFISSDDFNKMRKISNDFTGICVFI